MAYSLSLSTYDVLNVRRRMALRLSDLRFLLNQGISVVLALRRTAFWVRANDVLDVRRRMALRLSDLRFLLNEMDISSFSVAAYCLLGEGKRCFECSPSDGAALIRPTFSYK